MKKAGDQLQNKDSGLRKLVDKDVEKKRPALIASIKINAISFTGNSALINVQDKNEAALKGYNLLFKDENKNEEEKLRDNLTWGKSLYASNKFILAGLQFRL